MPKGSAESVGYGQATDYLGIKRNTLSAYASSGTEEASDEFVGYGPAADYLGIQRNTLSAYVSRGVGPPLKETRSVGQYNLPVFDRAGLDEWNKNRPGQGARTDLANKST